MLNGLIKLILIHKTDTFRLFSSFFSLYFLVSDQTDPTDAASGISRTYRGGDWYDGWTIQSAYRYYNELSYYSSDIDFRIDKLSITSILIIKGANHERETNVTGTTNLRNAS